MKPMNNASYCQNYIILVSIKSLIFVITKKNMKKITILAIAALGITFASCKKNRTCTCTYVNQGSGKASTQITTFTNVTKKDALSNCSSGTSYNIDEPNDMQFRTCTLK